MQHQFVSQQGLENLRTYKYAGVDNSLAGRLFLNAFWSWGVEKLPLWLAPNVVTLFGGICMAAAALLCAVLAPHFDEALPWWAQLLSAVLIFWYQTADNLDGKQARRTKAGSPMGELFDHGLDSLVMGFICTVICSAVRIGAVRAVVVGLVASSLFWLSHWEELHAGILVMGALTGPTELQLGAMALLCVSSVLPTGFWLQSVFGGYCTLNEAVFVVVLVVVCIGACNYAWGVWKLTRPGGATVIAGCTTRQAFRQPLVYLLYLALSIAWVFSTKETVETDPQLYVFASTASFGYITQRLIAQRICKEPFHAPIVPLIPVALATLNGIFKSSGVSFALDPFSFLLAVLIFNVSLELYFAVSIIRQLSSFLNIRPFVIPYPPPQ